MEKLRYIAFWNGDIDNPTIVTDIPKKNETLYKMVLVELTEIPVTNTAKFNQEADSLNKDLGKVSLELKKLSQTLKKIPKW